MDENKNATKLTQRDYQRKYDKKTKTVSVKYVLSDMQDYERMKDYLKKTGQSTNSFIKMLVKSFFEKGYDRYEYPIPKEREKREYYKFDCISEEYFEKLKRILGGDEEKYNMVLDNYDDSTKIELEFALEDKGCVFEEWVDEFEENVNSGEINLDLSGRDFEKMIGESMNQSIGGIFCG